MLRRIQRKNSTASHIMRMPSFRPMIKTWTTASGTQGDFVWLLKAGDTIPQGHIELAIELITKHPKAFNILANVHKWRKETKQN